MTNIKEIIRAIEIGKIDTSIDFTFHTIEYIDAIDDIYVVHTVEGYEGLEVFYAERVDWTVTRSQGEDFVNHLVFNEYADQFDYDTVVAYRMNNNDIVWL